MQNSIIPDYIPQIETSNLDLSDYVSNRYEFKLISRLDLSFMEDMLYNAIYVEDNNQIPRDIIYKPELYKYIDNWDDEKDIGFIAVDKIDKKKLGAAWIRSFKEDNKGYGFIDENIPELSIAIYPEHRGRGLGTELIKQLFINMPEDIQAISLSVNIKNPAKRLYERLGFKDHYIEDGTATMKYDKEK